MNDYARFWRAAREAHGLSQSEIARRMGIAQAAVSAVERGLRRYTLKQTVSLIEMLDLDPSRIIAMLLANDERALRKAFRLKKGQVRI